MTIEVQGVSPLIQIFHMSTSIRFYRDVLGFVVAGKSKPISDDPDDVGWAMLQLGAATIMLNTAYDPDAVPEAPDAARWSGHQDTVSISHARTWTGLTRNWLQKG
jgi:glyoxylase I family protein